MNKEEIKKLASDTRPFDDTLTILSTTKGDNTFPDNQEKRVAQFMFNKRSVLIDLIEYTRSASPGYGITNILENFMNDHPHYQHSFEATIKWKENA